MASLNQFCFLLTISKTDSTSAYVLIARNISCVNCPKLPKWQFLRPQNCTKNETRGKSFLNLSSRQLNFSNDI